MNGDRSNTLDDLDARIREWMHTREPATPSPEIVAAAMSRVNATAQRSAILVRPLARQRALPRTSLLGPALAFLLVLVLAAALAIVGARLLLDHEPPPD